MASARDRGPSPPTSQPPLLDPSASSLSAPFDPPRLVAPLRMGLRRGRAAHPGSHRRVRRRGERHGRRGGRKRYCGVSTRLPATVERPLELVKVIQALGSKYIGSAGRRVTLQATERRGEGRSAYLFFRRALPRGPTRGPHLRTLRVYRALSQNSSLTISGKLCTDASFCCKRARRLKAHFSGPPLP